MYPPHSPGHDPDEQRIDARDVEADRGAQVHEHDRHRVAEIDEPLAARLRVDVAPVDVVDEVGGRRVQGRRERRDECREQSRDDQAEDTGRRKLAHRRRQDAIVVGDARRGDAELVEIGDGEDREAGDQQVADRHQHEGHEAAHHRRLARRARGEDLLHVVVGRGAGGADQHALEQHHHHERAEQREAVARDLVVERRETAAPAEVERPAEERRVPASGRERRDRRRIDALDGDDGDDHRDDRHQRELQDVRPHDAEHAAEHGVDHRERGEGDAVEVGDVSRARRRRAPRARPWTRAGRSR